MRVGIILPFGSSTAATRNLATAMMNAAELALFDGKNKDIVLMTADEGNGAAPMPPPPPTRCWPRGPK